MGEIVTTEMSRRRLLAAAGSATALGLTALPAPARASSVVPAATVLPGDGRYPDLTTGANQRFTATPESVRLPSTTAQVVYAVQEAVRAGKRIAVRSGGHCVENLVANPSVQVTIDLSQLTGVHFDPKMRAFEVWAGTTVREIQATLYRTWGVTVPAGSCGGVGAGGHITGGGYGPLTRRAGLVADHLYAVEVVVVNSGGTARSVVATRDNADAQLRDLWWAHTGGGGGNLGVITRFWLRSPGAEGSDPAGLLPRPPAQYLMVRAGFPWAPLTESTFGRLIGNYCAWYAANRAPGSAGSGVYSILGVPHRQSGGIGLSALIDTAGGAADTTLEQFLDAVGDGVGLAAAVRERRRMSWWHATTWNGMADAGDTTRRLKLKSGYLRGAPAPAQLSALYRHLTRTDYADPATAVVFDAFGGAAGAVAPDATAFPHRDAAVIAAFQALWLEPADDERHVTALRELYRDVYAETGGVPVRNAVNSGCYINYPDADLADPAWNTSGVSAQTLYYQENYPRLQQIKAAWDPRNVFQHGLSVRSS
jgi:hypothetical protein